MFAVIFTMEAVVKLTAYRWQYFRDNWNNFDLFIVVGTIVGTLMSQITDVSVGSQATVIRSFRIGRMFKLLKRNKSLKIIFDTFLVTLPGLFNLGGLLVLFLYIYSVLGIYLFSLVKINEPMNSYINF